MKEIIPIVLAANEAYVPFCLSTIASVISSQDEHPGLEFYILTSGISDVQSGRIKSWAIEREVTVSIVTINDGQFQHLPTPEHISLDAYSRLLAPELLPQLDKFIYLDCDVVVVDSLSELLQVDMSGGILGAVRQRNSEMQLSVVERFNVSSQILYINSGVLLIDAKAWRGQKVTSGILDWMAVHSGQLQMADQEPLIVYLEDQVYELNPKWNVEARHYTESRMGMPMEADLVAAMEVPSIIHYTGSVKPWSLRGYVPRRALYVEHLATLPPSLQAVEVKLKNSFLDYCVMALGVCRFRIGALLKRKEKNDPISKA
jgi:lipopolysaccharide biosynthesis glycosyltransferase